MIAAIYARKSNEQNGVADEEKSVARQVERARAYAARKGWTVADEHVYRDDGISGAEFEKRRPGLARLMNALKPRPSFAALIMMEEERLGREQIETAYLLKQIITAGVRVHYYLDDQERVLDSPTDKLLMHVATFASEVERVKARQRTYDAMAHRARAGRSTGGLTFGYVNRPVLDAAGRRSYVERTVEPREAGVIERIFRLAADGCGVKRIAGVLNAEASPAPIPRRRGRPRGWAPSSVREILARERIGAWRCGTARASATTGDRSASVLATRPNGSGSRPRRYGSSPTSSGRPPTSNSTVGARSTSPRTRGTGSDVRPAGSSPPIY
jgi:site-specific DNA recombinase